MKYLFFNLIFLFAIFVFLSSQILVVQSSASTSISFTVNNSAPVASNVAVTNAVAGNVNLTAGTTTTTTVTFTVTDNNGCEEIDAGSPDTDAIFYRTNVSGGIACTPDNANCYNMSCTQDGGSCTAGGADLTATYTCTSAVQFYADPTDAGSTYSATTWTAGVTPADGAGAGSADTSTTVEVVSLTSLSVTSTIAYDTLALNANTGTTDETTVVTNTGNRAIDAQVGGYGTSTGDDKALTCTVGSVGVAYEKYSIVASTAYASKTALPADDVPDTITLNLAVGASSTDDVYWGMGLPESGAGVSCSGHVVFTAVNYVAQGQQTAGPLSPGTAAEDTSVGDVSWYEIDNIKVNDTNYSITNSYSGISYYIKATNFGFNIPTDATVDGILMEVRRKGNGSDPGDYWKDYSVKIVKADGSIGTTNKADTVTHWGDFAYVSYGSSSDKWGETWTASNINDSDFGVVFSGEGFFGEYGTNGYVDHIRITVYYTE